MARQFNFTGKELGDADLLLISEGLDYLLASAANIPTEEHGTFFITLVKLDKIGLDGVTQECLDRGFNSEQVAYFFDKINQIYTSSLLVEEKISLLPESISDEVKLHSSKYFTLFKNN